jgi:predicted CopG family antitoxin
MKKLTITIDEKSLAELKRQAKEENRNVSQHIRELVKKESRK